MVGQSRLLGGRTTVSLAVLMVMVGSLLVVSARSVGAEPPPPLGWAAQLGAPGASAASFDVAVDDSGNVYTTGFFSGTADFDPGPATANLTSAGNDDVFVSKLDSAGNFVWAAQLGGTGSDAGQGVTVDGAGNVYTTGYFNGTVDFDPGAATVNLTSAGIDVFVSKLDSAGNFVWAAQLGGASGDRGRGVAVDGSGNLYITGFFAGTADFDPGAATFNLTSAGSDDVFVSKLDSAGNFVWAAQLGGTSDDTGFGAAVDGAGNVYTTGSFRGTADFDPGAATANLTSAGYDVFVSKLDSAGNFVWAAQLGGTATDLGLSVAVDGAGNVYTTGYFAGTADFDPGPATVNVTSAGVDVFVSKLDSAGNFVWAVQLGGTGTDLGFGVAVDGAGNVYTTGYFNGTVDFDPGAATVNLTSAGNDDVFVSKLDSAGNFVWAAQLGGTGSDSGRGVAVDGAGNVYITGPFEGTADFDPGPATVNLTSAGSNDVFVSKLVAPSGPSDTTPPSITPNVVGTVVNNGWHTTDVDVSWTVTDPDSPISSSTGCGATTISADTAGVTLSCSAASDGGTASESVTIKRDATAPAASASALPAANGNGWNNTDVTVSFTGTDALSGLDSCDANTVLSTDGASQSASGTCTDLAGNVSASADATSIDIDKTAPVVDLLSLSLNPKALTESTTLTAQVSDNLSGVVAVEYSIDGGAGIAMPLMGTTATAVFDDSLAEGVYQIDVRTQDAAGNWSETSSTYLVVFDPAGAWATGGGWIIPGGANSDPGDILPGLDGTSRAHFGFKVAYRNGNSTVPSGNLSFRYVVQGQGPTLVVEDAGFDWLVVTNNTWAKFRGEVTIDGMAGLFPVHVDARDSNNQPDRFIIKIWAPGADPDADDPIYKASGDVTGNIKIHN